MLGENVKLPIYVVDAFTDSKFSGNPAAVCLLKNEISEELMQNIAAEMNLSETAFLRSLDGNTIPESQKFSLRWFTPKVEVPLCGHATLATSAVLFFELDCSEYEIEFETKSGILKAKKEKEGVLLDFPKEDPVVYEPPGKLISNLGILNYESVMMASKLKYVLIELKNEEDVLKVEPDFEKMNEVEIEDLIGVIITSKGTPPYDFISRFFAPWVGVYEDPVTGSAHTVLAPYWSKILNKNEMLAYQASERGGELEVRLKGDRVELIGEAQIVSKGELFI
jgi:PhzF family phenazine biosynthesis protein